MECELDSERTKRLASEALCDQHASDLSRARLDCENLQRQVLVLERARVAAEKQIRDVRHDANSLFKLRHTIEELKSYVVAYFELTRYTTVHLFLEENSNFNKMPFLHYSI